MFLKQIIFQLTNGVWTGRQHVIPWYLLVFLGTGLLQGDYENKYDLTLVNYVNPDTKKWSVWLVQMLSIPPPSTSRTLWDVVRDGNRLRSGRGRREVLVAILPRRIPLV